MIAPLFLSLYNIMLVISKCEWKLWIEILNIRERLWLFYLNNVSSCSSRQGRKVYKIYTWLSRAYLHRYEGISQRMELWQMRMECHKAIIKLQTTFSIQKPTSETTAGIVKEELSLQNDPEPWLTFEFPLRSAEKCFLLYL